MPSFDIVSEVDTHEIRNAVDQANREVGTRYDFKGVNAAFTLTDEAITLKAEVDFQLEQMMDILRQKMTKRQVDIKHLQPEEPTLLHKQATQAVKLQTGVSTDLGRDIVKKIKNAKLKVQAAIQGDQVRVTGKKRDDLQSVIALLKESDISIPLQFVNFRD